MTDNSDTITKPIKWLPIIVVSGLVLLIWFLNWYLPSHVNDPGATGDMFGVSNSLFSALAFAGIIYTILLQKEELQLQRLELRQTRKELKGQKEQLALQAQTQKIQQFESTFFQMVSLHNEKVSQMIVEAGRPSEKTGQRCIERIYKGYLLNGLAKLSVDSTSDEIGAQINSVGVVMSGMMAPYFRELYRIIEFVDNQHPINKYFYTNLICDTMSTHEKLILFYFALSSLAPNGFQSYINEYALLRDLAFSELADSSHKAFYHKNAYGKEEQK